MQPFLAVYKNFMVLNLFKKLIFLLLRNSFRIFSSYSFSCTNFRILYDLFVCFLLTFLACEFPTTVSSSSTPKRLRIAKRFGFYPGNFSIEFNSYRVGLKKSLNSGSVFFISFAIFMVRSFVSSLVPFLA